MIQVFRDCSDIFTCLLLENIQPSIMLFALQPWGRQWRQKEAAIITPLFFCTLEQTEEICRYCHEDVDLALLGGMADQKEYHKHPKPGCTSKTYSFPSNNNFFPFLLYPEMWMDKNLIHHYTLYLWEEEEQRISTWRAQYEYSNGTAATLLLFAAFNTLFGFVSPYGWIHQKMKL